MAPARRGWGALPASTRGPPAAGCGPRLHHPGLPRPRQEKPRVEWPRAAGESPGPLSRNREEARLRPQRPPVLLRAQGRLEGTARAMTSSSPQTRLPDRRAVMTLRGTTPGSRAWSLRPGESSGRPGMHVSKMHRLVHSLEGAAGRKLRSSSSTRPVGAAPGCCSGWRCVLGRCPPRREVLVQGAGGAALLVPAAGTVPAVAALWPRSNLARLGHCASPSRLLPHGCSHRQ